MLWNCFVLLVILLDHTTVLANEPLCLELGGTPEAYHWRPTHDLPICLLFSYGRDGNCKMDVHNFFRRYFARWYPQSSEVAIVIYSLQCDLSDRDQALAH